MGLEGSREKASVTDQQDMTGRADEETGDGGRTDEGVCGLQRRFAGDFAAAASTLTGLSVSVQPVRWGRESRMQFLLGVAESTCCRDLSSDRDQASGAMLEIAPQIAWPMIDSLLGGPGDGSYLPSRALTVIEQRLLSRLASAAGQCLGGDLPTAPPRDSDRPGIVLDFLLSVGESSGAVRLFLPEDPACSHHSTPSVGLVEISVTAGEMSLEVGELAALAVGDILTTDAPGDGEVTVRVAGIPKYRARLGACNGRRAITILGPIDPAAGEKPTPSPADSP